MSEDRVAMLLREAADAVEAVVPRPPVEQVKFTSVRRTVHRLLVTLAAAVVLMVLATVVTLRGVGGHDPGGANSAPVVAQAPPAPALRVEGSSTRVLPRSEAWRANFQ